MRFTHRALKSLMRNLSHTTGLLLVLTILSVLLMSMMSINHIILYTNSNAVNHIKPLVVLDYSNDDSYMVYENVIDKDLVQQIYEKNKDLIAAYDYSMSLSVKNNQLVNAQLFNDLMYTDSTNFNLIGTETTFSSDVLLNNATIRKGQGFVNLDDNYNKIIISHQFAIANGLDIGNSVAFEVPVYDYSTKFADGSYRLLETIKINFEIVGIVDYMITQNIDLETTTHFDAIRGSIITDKVNQLVVPNQAIESLNAQIKTIYEQASINESITAHSFDLVTPLFVLYSHNDIEQFIDQAYNLIDTDYMTFLSTNDLYQQSTNAIDTMQSVIFVFLIITLIISLVLITLFFYLLQLPRKNEFCLYHLCGDKPSTMFSQLLIERVTIGVVAFVLSYFISRQIVVFTMDRIFETIFSFNSLTQVLNTNTILSTTQIFDPIVYNFTYQISVNSNIMSMFMLIILVVVVLSQVVAFYLFYRINITKYFERGGR